MSFSTKKTLITKLKFKEMINVYLNTGDVLVIPYSYTDKLSKTTKSELENYYLIGGGIGVHFEEIDEDISLKGIINYKISHELVA